MPGKRKLRLTILIILLVAATAAALDLFAENGLKAAHQRVQSLERENNRLKGEVNRLKKENGQLKDRIYRQKLQFLEEQTGLVMVLDVDETIVVDLRYAGKNNFTGEKLYPVEICLLQRDTAEKLKKANSLAARDGYRVKVWDAYRPLDIQKKFWQLVPDRRYVADPQYGSKHNRGGAVDVTLVDGEGNELVMPTGFDHFSEKAWRSYTGNTPEAQRNMEYLGRIMEESGFIPNTTEWWHFDDSRWKEYPVMNVKLEEFAP